MRKTALLLITLISLFAITSSYAASKLRVGLVDRQQLQETVREFWNENKTPQDHDFKAQQTDIKKIRQDLMAQRKKLDDDSLNEKDKSPIEAKIETLQKQLSEKASALRKKMLSKRTERVKLMQAKIKTKVAAVARKHKVNLVLASHQVMYADDEVDITADVIKAIKQK